MTPANVRAVAVDHLGLELYNTLKREVVPLYNKRFCLGLPGSTINLLDAHGYDFHGADSAWSYSRGGKIVRGFTSLDEALKSAYAVQFAVPKPMVGVRTVEILPIVGSDAFTFRLTLVVQSQQQFRSPGAAQHAAQLYIEQEEIEDIFNAN